MKIMFLTASFGSGGAERTISYISQYMAKEGHSVEVVSLLDGAFYQLNENVRMTSFGIDTNYRNFFERLSNIRKRYVRIYRHIKMNKPDVVFCMQAEMAKYVLKYKKKLGFVLITSERNNPALDGDSNLKTRIFNQSEGVIFQTERAKNWYAESIRGKSVVIHNAVGNRLAYEAKRTEEVKNIVSAVGRLTDQKDYPTLLAAFKRVLDRHTDFKLHIFGKGSDHEKLNNLVADLGIEESVEFEGECQDAILKIVDSAVYVLSSIYEGMPNALMEAMAIGLPCVSTDCPNGPGELIASGENGLLVPVGDAVALADAICKMIEDRDFAEKCGKNARKILDDHSISEIAKKYMEYIESVCGKTRNRLEV